MLSKKTKYAFKALVYLAKRIDQEPALIVDIAEHENIPRKFLEAILLELRNNGFLESKKGKGGGYSLKMRADEMYLTDLIRVMHGPLSMLPCVSIHFYQPCEECENEEICGIRDIFLELRNRTLEALEGKTIADMIEREVLLKKNRVLEFA